MRSGSSGNLLLLEAGHTRILVDCGLSTQRACRRILDEEVGLEGGIDGVLVTHAHSDHINYASLRVLCERGIPVYLHHRTEREVRRRYLNPYRVPASVDFDRLELRTFGDDAFRIDGLEAMPIPVPHAPGVTTHAFALRADGRRVLIASDFHDPDAVVPHIYDCDLIYLEANYDLDLLRRHFNPASLYHLPNPAAGLLLQHAIREGTRPPEAIVLGHLSEERNRPELALETVREILRDCGSPRLVAAPRYEAAEAVVI